VTPIERLLNAKDLVQFEFGTPKWMKMTEFGAARIQRVKVRLEEFASLRGLWGLHEIGEKDLQWERLLRRYRTYGEDLIREIFSHGSDTVKAARFELVERMWSMKITRILQEKVAGLRPGNPRREIGFLSHWLQEQMNKAEWEEKVARGLAQPTPRGGYRDLINGKLGDIEEIFEWKLPSGQRIDFARIDHKKKEICITDLAAQLRKEHLEKTINYAAEVRKVPVLAKYRVPPPTELYWDEKDARVLKRLMGSF